MQDILETPLLRLRQLTVHDAEFILRLVNTEGWLEFIGNRGITTIEEAQIYLITGPVNNYLKQGFGLYMVELKNDTTGIGICGLIKRDGLEHVDLGFAFLPEFMGMGYAFEAARATLKFAQQVLGIQRVVSITLPHNQRAIRLLHKLGFEYRRKIRLPHEDQDLMLFDEPGNTD